MSVKSLIVSGYRGFAQPQEITFAIPNNTNEGSGLTFLLGANNSGKSAFLEALKFFAGHSTPELNGSQRNIKTSKKVHIELKYLDSLIATLKTVTGGGSTTEITWPDNNRPQIFYLPSRRLVNHEFFKGRQTRIESMNTLSQKGRDNNVLEYFYARLFDLIENPDNLKAYNRILTKVLGYELKWIIEKENNHFIQYEIDSITHKGEGAGDGIINLMIIAEAIHNASPADTIIIDEPEVSLHPSAQKQLFNALKELSKTTQIIIATHSPYFIDFEAIEHGAQISRFYKEGDEIRIAELPSGFNEKIKRFLSNASNPHILGTNAKEIFFVRDCVLLVEGQDDALCIEKAARKLNVSINGNIFGWGVGGETNMPFFADLLKSLGYKKVCGLLDNNATIINDLRNDFPDYHFLQISTDDIRDKKAENARTAKTGLFTSKFELKSDSEDEIKDIIESINQAFEKL